MVSCTQALTILSRSEALAALDGSTSTATSLELAVSLFFRQPMVSASQIRGALVLDEDGGHICGAVQLEGVARAFRLGPKNARLETRSAGAGAYSAYCDQLSLRLSAFDPQSSLDFWKDLYRARTEASMVAAALDLTATEVDLVASRDCMAQDKLTFFPLDDLVAAPSIGTQDLRGPEPASSYEELIDGVIADLESGSSRYTDWKGDFALPRLANVAAITRRYLEVVLPGYHGRRPKAWHFREHTKRNLLWLRDSLAKEIHRARRYQFRDSATEGYQERSLEQSEELIGKFVQLRQVLSEDINAALEGDPAVFDHHEIALAYPGIVAVSIYRLAHELYAMNVPLLPRLFSEFAHSRYAIDIHPGAEIGPGFFLDHGSGVVIGQTAKVGRRVTLYQGVTLGALNFPKDEDGNLIRGQKRHPTLEDYVVVYANADILGGNTVVGRNSTIGAHVCLTHSVPPESLVVAERQPPRIVQKVSSK